MSFEDEFDNVSRAEAARNEKLRRQVRERDERMRADVDELAAALRAAGKLFDRRGIAGDPMVEKTRYGGVIHRGDVYPIWGHFSGPRRKYLYFGTAHQSRRARQTSSTAFRVSRRPLLLQRANRT